MGLSRLSGLLDSEPGHDFRIVGSSPVLGSISAGSRLVDSLSLSPPLPPSARMYSMSLKINK